MRYLLGLALLFSAAAQGTLLANLVLTCPDDKVIGQVALESCRGYVYERPTNQRVVATGSHRLKYWHKAGDLDAADTVLVCEIPVKPGRYSSCRDAEGARRMRFVRKDSIMGGASVTVQKTGGDYTDPVAAAANAFAGDTWCVAPQWPQQPCEMTIGAGVFILHETLSIPEGLAVSGAGKGATMLVADNGVETAAASMGNVLFSDLTIVNSQPGGAGATGLNVASNDFHPGLAQLHGVAIHVAGAARNVAIDKRFRLEILDSDITAVGQDASGLWGEFTDLPSPSYVTLERSHVSAQAAIHEARGYPTAVMRIVDSQVVGSVFFNPEESLLEIVRSGIVGDVTAINDWVRVVITDSSVQGNLNNLTTEGSGGTLITNTSVEGKIDVGYTREATFDGLRVHGEVEIVDAPVPVSILRSYIHSSSTGAALTIRWLSRDSLVRLDQTFVEGTLAVAVDAGNPEDPSNLEVTSSVLAGPVSAEVTAGLSCTDTYGADYELLSADCQPQER